MRTKGQIAQKIKQAQFRHVQKELKRLLKRSAPNCKKNRSMELEFGPVGVCSLDCQVCDVRFHNRAPECEDWELRHSKDEIKESLKEFFRTRAVPEIAVRFPDVAALLWALADDADPQQGPLMVGIPATTFFGIPVWVDTEEDHVQLKAAVAPILRYSVVLGALCETLEIEAPPLNAEVTRSIIEKVEHLVRRQVAHESDLLGKVKEAAELSGQVDARDEQIRRLEDRLAEVHERHRKEAMAAVAVRTPASDSLWRRLFPWFR
jgi:hypothetical protein